MRFTTAIADPPWPYGHRKKMKQGGTRIDGSTYHLHGYASQQYELLTLEELQALPVGELVTGYMLLWCPFPLLPEGLALLDAWGFQLKSHRVWRKTTGFGVGYWVRGDDETVLIAKRRGMPSVRTNESSVFEAPRGRHSAKPDHMHIFAERYLPGPYVELFGRRNRVGWTVVGDEAPGDGRDIRESLKLLLSEEVVV